jgi:hypothetical protein
MRKLNLLFLVVGLASIAACGSDPTPPYVPVETANGVFPAQAFTGRKVRVEISGDNTNWSASEGGSPTLNFGDGITVDTVEVASPTALFANLTIAGTASISTRDVTVTFGATTLTLKGAFHTVSPIEISVNGVLAQGSVATFTIKNKDFENLFDTTFTGDGFFTPIVYTNVAVTGPTGVNLQVGNVTEFAISGTLLIDVDAMPGTVSLASGPTGSEVTSVAPTLMVAARAATALTSGTATTGVIATPTAGLYELTPSGLPALAQFAVTATGNAPGVAVLPASGHFSDLISAGSKGTTILKTGKLYAVVYDLSGGSGYTFTLKGTATALVSTLVEAEPNDTGATAQQVVTAPVFIDAATLSSDTDLDFYKLTVPAGKKIHIVTAPGDLRTDTQVDVFGPNNAATAFGPPSDDNNYHEDWTTAAVTVAGTYYVRISASSFGLVAGNSAYVAAIILE